MTPRLLQRARLMIPFKARMSKGPVKRGQQCHLVQYILYASREACHLCHTDAKAERQVVVEAGGRTLHSGLNCFEDISGITARQLELFVKGHLGVALRLRNLSDEGFADESAMLSHIERLLDLLPKGTERNTVTSELRRLKAADHFTPPDLRWLEDVLDLLALLQLAKADPGAYARMVEAVFTHPSIKAEEARKRLLRDNVANPARLSVFQAAELRKAIRAISELNITLHFTPAVRPWDFPDREAYMAGLAAHYRAEAEAGNTSQVGRLQLQHDLVHQGRRPPTIEDILTNLGIPCVLPVYEHPAIAALDLAGPRALRLVERGNRLPHGVLDDQFHHGGTLHQATVRTDPEGSRMNNRGVTRPPGPGDTTDIPFRGVAYWRPDPWYPVYSLWHAYGREQLHTFPALE